MARFDDEDIARIAPVAQIYFEKFSNIISALVSDNNIRKKYRFAIGSVYSSLTVIDSEGKTHKFSIFFRKIFQNLNFPDSYIKNARDRGEGRLIISIALHFLLYAYDDQAVQSVPSLEGLIFPKNKFTKLPLTISEVFGEPLTSHFKQAKSNPSSDRTGLALEELNRQWDWFAPSEASKEAAVRKRLANLLVARYRIVEYQDFRGELQSLIDWASSSTSRSGRLYTGTGGAGKTRIAIELVARVPKSWAVHFIDSVSQLQSTVHAQVTSPRLLLIVDYAESKQEELFAICKMAKQVNVPVRVLALARSSVNWWTNVYDDEDVNDIFEDGPFQLHSNSSAVGLTLDERVILFNKTRDDFEFWLKKVGKNVRAPSTPNLSNSDFSSPLAVAMAAFIDLFAPFSDETFSKDDHIVAKVYKLERQAWARALAPLVGGRKAITRNMMVFMLRTMGNITLQQGVLSNYLPDSVRLDCEFAKYDVRTRDSIIEAVRNLYSDDFGDSSIIRPIEPDLLGELVVARMAETDIGLNIIVDVVISSMIAEADTYTYVNKNEEIYYGKFSKIVDVLLRINQHPEDSTWKKYGLVIDELHQRLDTLRGFEYMEWNKDWKVFLRGIILGAKISYILLSKMINSSKMNSRTIDLFSNAIVSAIGKSEKELSLKSMYGLNSGISSLYQYVSTNEERFKWNALFSLTISYTELWLETVAAIVSPHCLLYVFESFSSEDEAGG